MMCTLNGVDEKNIPFIRDEEKKLVLEMFICVSINLAEYSIK